MGCKNMSMEEITKYAYTCMVKNNPDEAIKNLILYNEENEILKSIIHHALRYISQFDSYIPEDDVSNLITLLKGYYDGGSEYVKME